MMKASNQLMQMGNPIGLSRAWAERPEDGESYKKQIEMEVKRELKRVGLALAMQFREGITSYTIKELLSDAQKISAYLSEDLEDK